MTTLTIPCSCYSQDHLLVASADPFLVDNAYPAVLEMQLNPHRSFWRRVLVSLRYIFKPHGVQHWEETLLTRDDTTKLAAFLTASLDVLR